MRNSSWSEAVVAAVMRYIAHTGSIVFTRTAFKEAELHNIVVATGSAGLTPDQTLSRELQQLRDAGLLEFIGQGTYRWLGQSIAQSREGASRGVFVVGLHSIYQDELDQFYCFPPKCMANASKVIGNWIIYQRLQDAGGHSYFAVAKVEKIIPDPISEGMYLALIEAGSFLEFGQEVPLQPDRPAIDGGLFSSDRQPKNRAAQSIRPISHQDFDRILEIGLGEEQEVLPQADEERSASLVMEDRIPWEGPMDRTTALARRTVRDRQFRKRVLNVYDRRCAFTGLRIINGSGRVETEAAHIKSVEARGPDSTVNSIALIRTVHWMFDNGSISMSDEGDILLSSNTNDIDKIQPLLYSDRKARLPILPEHRPHPRFLDWHRRERFCG